MCPPTSLILLLHLLYDILDRLLRYCFSLLFTRFLMLSLSVLVVVGLSLLFSFSGLISDSHRSKPNSHQCLIPHELVRHSLPLVESSTDAPSANLTLRSVGKQLPAHPQSNNHTPHAASVEQPYCGRWFSIPWRKRSRRTSRAQVHDAEDCAR